MPYQLLAHKDANKDLAGLPPRIADGIRRVLHDLALRPRSSGFDIRPIQGHSSLPPTLRLRIASYRVLLKIDHAGKRIVVLRARHRNVVYRGLEHLDEDL